ncbi:CoA pyrophosphatase [Aquibaculum sediminis]|uniref:CoA pyrophosphatase n=1 Tax=Aquibaculum sediminis TaxID=3231907 RepID=UPI003453BCE2
MEQRTLLSSDRVQSESSRTLVTPDLLAAVLREGRSKNAAPEEPTAVLRGDHDLNPDLRCPGGTERPAAVLVPLFGRRREPHVLLTRRSSALTNHAGQIAFPGGCSEPEDADARATALRETQEEIGLGPERIQPLGQLDLYVTRTGFAVTPIVGWIQDEIALDQLILDPREVDEVFEVPLGFFLDPANRQRHARTYEGRARYFYAYPYRNYYIWGATAGMLNNLAERLLGREC